MGVVVEEKQVSSTSCDRLSTRKVVIDMSEDQTKIGQALEEHLNAINENTTEIHALFDYLQEMEVKLEKVSQRLDALQLNQNLAPGKFFISPLNQTEKKVFLVLYTEEQPLTYEEVAVKASVSAPIVPETISSLIAKGVPLSRSFYNDQLFFKLDPQFKERQAKENVVNLSLQSFME